MIRLRNILFFLTAILTSAALAEVWPHHPQRLWNESWEEQYSAWVARDVDSQWLQKPESLFYKWKLDCADFIYLTRLTFAYQNGLEFKMHDPQAPGKKFISSRDSTWDEISSPRERLNRFARYIITQGSTFTLPWDTTLIPIRRDTVKPGVILLSDRQRQHSQLLKNVRPSGIPLLLAATLPESEYLYESYVFPAAETAFPSGRIPRESEGGLRRWKWPQDLNKNPQQIAYSSTEQSRLPYASFFETVIARLRVTEKNSSEHFQYMLEDACMKMRVRVNVIIDASHALLRLNGKAFSKQELDLYSTPSRDRDILNSFQQLDQYYLYNRHQIQESLLQKYQTLLHPQFNSQDFCWVQWANNRVEPLGLLRTRFLEKKISSDPYAPFAQRWGEF
ncbi:MAG: hypothetical protein AAGB31_12085 [Bdellovibrio sp.]